MQYVLMIVMLCDCFEINIMYLFLIFKCVIMEYLNRSMVMWLLILSAFVIAQGNKLEISRKYS